MNKENTTLILAFSGALLAVFLCSRGCNKKPTPPPTPREVIITKIDTLRVHDKVLVEKWHKAIHTTDSVVKLVYFSAPDTCDPYINEVVKAYQNERDSVSAVVNSKDSIITQYSLLAKVDSATIQQRNDSIANHKCKRIKWFVIGFGAGYATAKGVEIINKIK